MTTNQSLLLERYSMLEYILLGDLRDLLEEPADPENRKWLLAVLDCLLETLPNEFDLQDEDGYMSEVLDRHPHWNNQVEQLHRNHEQLFLKLKELRGRIVRDNWIAPIANEVRRDLRDWVLTIVALRRRETRMVQTAMNLEVGVGD
ncbi:MAG: hypothetical protein EXS05_09910 [Planctomycetaceae bacterium]|nr:hypothetical protein [Planctomycetaceae bacterium]